MSTTSNCTLRVSPPTSRGARLAADAKIPWELYRAVNPLTAWAWEVHAFRGWYGAVVSKQ